MPRPPAGARRRRGWHTRPPWPPRPPWAKQRPRSRSCTPRAEARPCCRWWSTRRFAASLNRHSTTRWKRPRRSRHGRPSRSDSGTSGTRRWPPRRPRWTPLRSMRRPSSATWRGPVSGRSGRVSTRRPPASGEMLRRMRRWRPFSSRSRSSSMWPRTTPRAPRQQRISPSGTSRCPRAPNSRRWPSRTRRKSTTPLRKPPPSS
mmetsp:Transcript_47676/g.137238  ORF Transcript_47676/g.137238 Transcript_47676/m.137238 type:complete len:203 (+) Transcript_47676:789-1397(+)